MSLVYDRRENQEEVVFVFKYNAAWYLIMLFFLLSAPFTKGIESFMLVLFSAAALVYIFGRAKANREIRQAMKNGKVAISGSKFSFKNPITFTIKK